jgi:hypothetical protein
LELIKIVALGLVGAIAYGVIHDQVTVRVCLEYFTIGHPPLIRSTSPTLLALAWGVVATWWVGLPLGVMVALAARRGRYPKLTAAQVSPFVLWLLIAVGLLALASGLLAYGLALRGNITLPKDWADLLSAEARIPFLVDLWTHSASYLFGILGSAVVSGLIYHHRRGLAQPAVSPTSNSRRAAPDAEASST